MDKSAVAGGMPVVFLQAQPAPTTIAHMCVVKYTARPGASPARLTVLWCDLSHGKKGGFVCVTSPSFPPLIVRIRSLGARPRHILSIQASCWVLTKGIPRYFSMLAHISPKIRGFREPTSQKMGFLVRFRCSSPPVRLWVFPLVDISPMMLP